MGGWRRRIFYGSSHHHAGARGEPAASKESLAQLVGRVDVHTQHLSSNPHIHEFRFLFILEAQAGTHAIYLENYALIFTKIKNLSTHS